MTNSTRLAVNFDHIHLGHRWPATRGVPLPEGELRDVESAWVENPEGVPVPAQFRVLSRWPDGSIKWVLTDFTVAASTEVKVEYAFCYSEEAPATTVPAAAVEIEERDEEIIVCTGTLRFAVSRKRFSLFERAELGRLNADGKFIISREVNAAGAGGEAWVRICESFMDGEGGRRLYGMGGNCLASLVEGDYSVEVEEAGPLRVVIKCSGAFEADIPAHHYSGYRPFRFVLRVYAYAGERYVRVLHTIVVACNPRETEVEEIGVRVPISLESGSVRVSTATMQGALEKGETLYLAQHGFGQFTLQRESEAGQRTIARGERTEGWMTVDDGEIGFGVGLRHMPEEYPKALRGHANGIDLYLWKDADGGRLGFNRYAEEVSWGDGEGVYADGTGTAKTSEFFLCFFDASDADDAPDRLRGLLSPPHVALGPSWTAHCRVTGGFAAFNDRRFPESERMMSGFLDWMERHIRMGGWYGFLDWGDVRVAWDAEVDAWRFHGRWGWCNSEWDPRHAVWIQYLRTGEERYFRLAEAMTRHSVDVDTCHYHPFRPYMVGGCFRHSIDHFGDEPCASHTFVDNWVDYYYATGDLRTRDVLEEAGAFFLRYRWTEEGDHSLSLRSIANALRGLLYLYEITGETAFRDRAEEVYEVIARGQNEDGSWHKRFQVSTADRLPNQVPYGMATEGTTLAVEMGTAPPFTDEEFYKLRGEAAERIRDLPMAEQKGYQTHYLMIGLELLHRITGREDVSRVYLRAVNWFCGHPKAPASDTAQGQRYGGIICRHLAYAFHLTGERKYLEIGQAVLRSLIEDQDWSDDSKRRGAVELSTMSVSLLFFGVPYLLGMLEKAGMGENP